MSEQGPVITINEEHRALLEAKKAEFQAQRNEDRYTLPEDSEAYYALSIITALLENGEINTYELSREMLKTMGMGFNLGFFERYCGLIENLAMTGTADGSEQDTIR